MLRKSKRNLIEEYFLARVGVPQNTMALHMKFGTAARTRISEINRDESAPIVIKNRTWRECGGEHSEYVAKWRHLAQQMKLEMTA